MPTTEDILISIRAHDENTRATMMSVANVMEQVAQATQRLAGSMDRLAASSGRRARGERTAAQATLDHSKALKKVTAEIRAMERATADTDATSRKVNSSLGTATTSLRRASASARTGVIFLDELAEALDQSSMTGWKFTMAMIPLRNIMFQVSAATVGLGAALYKTLQATSKIKGAESMLSVLIGDPRKAKADMDYVLSLAPKFKDTIEQTIEGAKLLATEGYDIKKLLIPMAQLSAGVNQEGIDISDAVRAFTDAMAGDMKRMKNTFHITRAEIEKFGGSFDSNGGAINKLKNIDAIISAINAKYGKVLDAIKETFSFQITNLYDSFFRMMSKIGEPVLELAIVILPKLRAAFDWVAGFAETPFGRMLIKGTIFTTAVGGVTALTLALIQLGLQFAQIVSMALQFKKIASGFTMFARGREQGVGKFLAGRILGQAEEEIAGVKALSAAETKLQSGFNVIAERSLFKSTEALKAGDEETYTRNLLRSQAAYRLFDIAQAPERLRKAELDRSKIVELLATEMSRETTGIGPSDLQKVQLYRTAQSQIEKEIDLLKTKVALFTQRGLSGQLTASQLEELVEREIPSVLQEHAQRQAIITDFEQGRREPLGLPSIDARTNNVTANAAAAATAATASAEAATASATAATASAEAAAANANAAARSVDASMRPVHISELGREQDIVRARELAIREGEARAQLSGVSREDTERIIENMYRNLAAQPTRDEERPDINPASGGLAWGTRRPPYWARVAIERARLRRLTSGITHPLERHSLAASIPQVNETADFFGLMNRAQRIVGRKEFSLSELSQILGVSEARAKYMASKGQLGIKGPIRRLTALTNERGQQIRAIREYFELSRGIPRPTEPTTGIHRNVFQLPAHLRGILPEAAIAAPTPARQRALRSYARNLARHQRYTDIVESARGLAEQVREEQRARVRRTVTDRWRGWIGEQWRTGARKTPWEMNEIRRRIDEWNESRRLSNRIRVAGNLIKTRLDAFGVGLGNFVKRLGNRLQFYTTSVWNTSKKIVTVIGRSFSAIGTALKNFITTNLADIVVAGLTILGIKLYGAIDDYMKKPIDKFITHIDRIGENIRTLSDTIIVMPQSLSTFVDDILHFSKMFSEAIKDQSGIGGVWRRNWKSVSYPFVSSLPFVGPYLTDRLFGKTTVSKYLRQIIPKEEHDNIPKYLEHLYTAYKGMSEEQLKSVGLKKGMTFEEFSTLELDADAALKLFNILNQITAGPLENINTYMLQIAQSFNAAADSFAGWMSGQRAFAGEDIFGKTYDDYMLLYNSLVTAENPAIILSQWLTEVFNEQLNAANTQEILNKKLDEATESIETYAFLNKDVNELLQEHNDSLAKAEQTLSNLIELDKMLVQVSMDGKKERQEQIDALKTQIEYLKTLDDVYDSIYKKTQTEFTSKMLEAAGAPLLVTAGPLIEAFNDFASAARIAANALVKIGGKDNLKEAAKLMTQAADATMEAMKLQREAAEAAIEFYDEMWGSYLEVNRGRAAKIAFAQYQAAQYRERQVFNAQDYFNQLGILLNPMSPTVKPAEVREATAPEPKTGFTGAQTTYQSSGMTAEQEAYSKRWARSQMLLAQGSGSTGKMGLTPLGTQGPGGPYSAPMPFTGRMPLYSDFGSLSAAQQTKDIRVAEAKRIAERQTQASSLLAMKPREMLDLQFATQQQTLENKALGKELDAQLEWLQWILDAREKDLDILEDTFAPLDMQLNVIDEIYRLKMEIARLNQDDVGYLRAQFEYHRAIAQKQAEIQTRALEYNSTYNDIQQVLHGTTQEYLNNKLQLISWQYYIEQGKGAFADINKLLSLQKDYLEEVKSQQEFATEMAEKRLDFMQKLFEFKQLVPYEEVNKAREAIIASIDKQMEGLAKNSPEYLDLLMKKFSIASDAIQDQSEKIVDYILKLIGAPEELISRIISPVLLKQRFGYTGYFASFKVPVEDIMKRGSELAYNAGLPVARLSEKESVAPWLDIIKAITTEISPMNNKFIADTSAISASADKQVSLLTDIRNILAGKYSNTLIQTSTFLEPTRNTATGTFLESTKSAPIHYASGTNEPSYPYNMVTKQDIWVSGRAQKLEPGENPISSSAMWIGRNKKTVTYNKVDGTIRIQIEGPVNEDIDARLDSALSGLVEALK